jgi:hypothetical protein
MNRAKTTMTLMARWLIVLAASLIVSSGNILASARPSNKSACTESCAQHCPCCISKSAPVESSVPLAPTPPNRTAIAKEFQLVAFCHALLLKELEAETIVPLHLSVPHFSVSLPVFVRHCSFLI